MEYSLRLNLLSQYRSPEAKQPLLVLIAVVRSDNASQFGMAMLVKAFSLHFCI